MSRPIGVFDSGLGGLTVVFNLQKTLPEENIVYFGDTARLPYGSKSPETINIFARQNTEFLLTFDPKIIVVACHTASALALENLQARFSRPILGVLAPGVEAALSKTRTGRIGVIGTTATIRSNSYITQIRRRNPRVKVYGYACPLFVPLAEEGLLSGKITRLAVARYLAPLKEKKIDTLILGCTHYPLLKREIARYMGTGVALIDPSEEVAKEVKKHVKESTGGPEPEKSFTDGDLKIYLSDITPAFRRVATSFLKKKLPHCEKVRIGG